MFKLVSMFKMNQLYLNGFQLDRVYLTLVLSLCILMKFDVSPVKFNTIR